MSKLSNQHCEACRIDAPRLSEEELQNLLPQIPGWEVISVENVAQLRREFKFSNFVSAIKFANKVGELAEAENHHPKLVVEWGRVTVYWWTHKIHGLHHNDAILAAKTNTLLD